MKKLSLVLLYGCIATGAPIYQAHAQELAFTSHHFNNNPAALLSLSSGKETGTAKPLTHASAKLTRLFNTAYKDAENVKWFNNGNGYLAQFDWAGVKTHALYGKNGFWYYDVRFGSEKDLSAADRHLIKSNYVDYKIGAATEVNVGEMGKAWIVNLEDAANLVQVRIVDGHLEELARYDTHPPLKAKKRAAITH